MDIVDEEVVEEDTGEDIKAVTGVLITVEEEDIEVAAAAAVVTEEDVMVVATEDVTVVVLIEEAVEMVEVTEVSTNPC